MRRIKFCLFYFYDGIMQQPAAKQKRMPSEDATVWL